MHSKASKLVAVSGVIARWPESLLDMLLPDTLLPDILLLGTLFSDTTVETLYNRKQ